jgi:hypothetical protein
MLDWSKTMLSGSAIALTLAMSACRGESESQQPHNRVEPTAKPSKPAAFREDTLDREGVILAAFHATTAAALGRDDKDAQRELRGRKFSVRIRFGCPGFEDPDRGWSYDEARKVLRVKVRSGLTSESLPASDLVGHTYQGVVGFTLGRPWLLTAGCPAQPFGAMAAGEPTIVIAQLFTAADSRPQRPERAYELTQAIEPNEQPSDGLDLVLSGRLAELPDGRPIHCAAQEGAPACIVSTKIDRVAIENPASGDVLGEWGPGAGTQ